MAKRKALTGSAVKGLIMCASEKARTSYRIRDLHVVYRLITMRESA